MADVKTIFSTQWTSRAGRVVPAPTDLALGNDAVTLEGVILYADLTASTQLVDSFSPKFAAEIYKAYLHCAGKVIRASSGDITAYDGDRIMAVFLGDNADASAVTAALKLNYARSNIINPAIIARYTTDYRVEHVVGIDRSPLFITRTGVRGANDLVWVGRAANHAAKLSALNVDKKPTWITKAIHDRLPKNLIDSTNGGKIWTPYTWTAMNGLSIHASTFHIAF